MKRLYILGNTTERFFKMSIKSNLNLIRGILYINEINKYKSITRAAIKNNIKAANLSLLLRDLEKQFGTKFFERTPSGCIPTAHGRQLSDFAEELNEVLHHINLWNSEILSDTTILNLYVSPNLHLGDCLDFVQNHPHLTLNFIQEELLADVIVSNQPPLNKNTDYTELYIGSEIKQKIWISCNKKSSIALDFFDFIIAKLLLLYDQPTP